ncbi:UbiA prenyltransferase family-domain-containing protein [Xylariaceae sp. FL1651]|nr:UbiA prenyltransferase family-domain-containing protein [Xylariaceae sp. FL1651]
MGNLNDSASLPAQKVTSQSAFAKQYGGIHSGTWVDYLPSSWIPYVQLSRLSPPVASFLIYLPHIFGVARASKVLNIPLEEVLRTGAILLGGSFFCNNASHAWNDLVDSSIDKMIPRTQSRPIPRGTISPRAALVFTVSQALVATAFLLELPTAAIKASIPTILITTYYPFAKRHTHFAQFVLAFCLTWGVMVGSASMGMERPWTDPSTLSLFLAAAVWVVVFDTIYAHQDLSGDLEFGVKSMAVLIKGRAKLVLWVFWGCLALLLGYSGHFGGMGFRYYAISMGGCLVPTGIMIFSVDLDDPKDCWGWFASGFWITGTCVAAGLVAEYLAYVVCNADATGDIA